jgi:hypothetical protein
MTCDVRASALRRIAQLVPAAELPDRNAQMSMGTSLL